MLVHVYLGLNDLLLFFFVKSTAHERCIELFFLFERVLIA